MSRKQDPEVDKALQIGDPFEFFEEQAYALHRELALPTGFVPEALAIVKGAFGESWLRTQVETKTRAMPLPLNVHPLGGCFAVRGPSDIVEVLELAVYIKRLIRIQQDRKSEV